MAEDIRHVFEAGAPVDHLRGGRVPEGVGAERAVGIPARRKARVAIRLMAVASVKGRKGARQARKTLRLVVGRPCWR